MEVRLEDRSSVVADTVSSSAGFRYVRDSDGNEFLALPLRAPMGARGVDARTADGADYDLAVTP